MRIKIGITCLIDPFTIEDHSYKIFYPSYSGKGFNGHLSNKYAEVSDILIEKIKRI